MPIQPRLITDKPSEPADREAYRERLKEYLKDPAFRAIEGFPIGEDEAILALSDPPYYTACPNPFLPEILARWQEERRQLRDELGMPADEAYHREPFATDVSEGKNDPIYNAHSYHTKVPHKAIMRYILHYTDPGDIVLDGFCGTGMTGVAAQLCGDRKAVQDLGYRMLDDGTVLDEMGRPFSRLGARKAVLIDLCPAATFIAYNYNTPVNVEAFEQEAHRILKEVEAECGWMYETWHVEPASCRLVAETILRGDSTLRILPSRILPSPAGGLPADKMPPPGDHKQGGITDFTVRQGNLPHWQLPGVHYFITFNTASHRQLSPKARDIVLGALKYWDGQRLDLIAAVVMPDHVHAVLVPREREPGVYWDLSDLMHSIKSYSANRINEVEDRRGETVWQSETYDHIIRDLGEYHCILSYIADNPVKAGLAQDPWGYRWFWLQGDLEQAGWKPAPRGRINYTVWSDVFVCPQCGEEMVFWEVAVDKEVGRVRKEFPCPHCGALHTKRNLDRAWETVYDRALKQPIRRAKQVPVLINYSVGKKRYEKVPDAEDLALIRRIEESDIPYWFPTDRMPEGEKTRDPMNVGITHVHHFYTRRNLWVLAVFVSRCLHHNALRALFVLSSINLHVNKMRRFQPVKPGGTPNLPGTLYVGALPIELSLFDVFPRKEKGIARAFRPLLPLRTTCIGTTSATDLRGISSSSIDYIFVDPPFGQNLQYSELNFLWEAWLRVFTNNEPEAVVNKVQGKRLPEYQALMEACFREFYRVLKPGRWMTVEFHNSQNAVWNAIQEALQRAGFVVADVRTFDKQQGTFNQVTAAGAVKQDLIISAYKPNEGLEEQFQLKAGTEEGVWDFVTYHLGRLPIPELRDGKLEVLAERQDYLLYDRMVAFHVQRGVAVPLSAAQFYAGLRERFPEREEMFFLPEQAAEYDRRRLRAEEVVQLPLIVTDERSAIQWLRLQLQQKPRTLGELQPLFMREAQMAWEKNEKPLELRQLLDENFLQDEHGRWYVPDPHRAQDLERMREKALLREFRQYAEGRGRLRVFRKEAVLVGFRRAWREKEYGTIVHVAHRLPLRVLQEDPALLMYYDNALGKVEG